MVHLTTKAVISMNGNISTENHCDYLTCGEEVLRSPLFVPAQLNPEICSCWKHHQSNFHRLLEKPNVIFNLYLPAGILLSCKGFLPWGTSIDLPNSASCSSLQFLKTLLRGQPLRCLCVGGVFRNTRESFSWFLARGLIGKMPLGLLKAGHFLSLNI